MKQKGQTADSGRELVLVLRNRRVRHDYEVMRCLEAGMVLTGSEVKSLRAGNVQWADAHGRIEDGELWLYGLYIGPYREAGYAAHIPTARRKLLLRRRDIDSLSGAVQAGGLTLIPERLIFRRGWAKCDLCLGRGLRKGDKRQALKDRETKRDIARAMARYS